MLAVHPSLAFVCAVALALVGAVRAPELNIRAAPEAPAAIGLGYRWHTFYGIASGRSELHGIAADANSNVYLVGHASTSWGTPLHAHSGDEDIVIIKLDGAGQYVWHTFYGAGPSLGEDGDDEGIAMAVDPNGDVFVTGYSDRTWQGPGNASPLAPHGGDAEYMFALKLNAGGQYQWHTFFQPGRATAIARGAGAIYIVGDGARSWGSPKHAYGGRLALLQFNDNGGYAWHTYHGAGTVSAEELALGVAVDQTRNRVYVTGQTPGSWLGAGGQAPLNAFSGGAGFSTDLFVLSVDTDGAYQWHTFHGADAIDDSGNAVALDDAGNVYVAGQSAGSWGAPLNAAAGERDLVLLKLGSNGARVWHTFLGSAGSDQVAATMAVRDDGVYLAGASAQPWQGPGNRAPVHAHSGFSDLVVARLGTSGAFLRHTFFGSVEGQDRAHALALDGDHHVLVAGHAMLGWLGANAHPPIRAHSAAIEGDGVVLKLADHVHRVGLPVVGSP